MIKSLPILFLLPVLALSACSISEEARAATAIAYYNLTQTAAPTSTPTSTPVPSSTATSTPTTIPTSTPTPTSTATATSTSTPMPTSTPVQRTAEGLPIFPSSGTSSGDGIEIAFSQGVLNAMGVRGVKIPPTIMNDVKQALVGQWLWILSVPGYAEFEVKSLDLLKASNSEGRTRSLWIGRNFFQNLGPDTTIRMEFVYRYEEYAALREAMIAEQTESVFETSIGVAGFDVKEVFLAHKPGSIKFMGYVPATFFEGREASRVVAEANVARFVYSMTYISKCYVSRIGQQNNLNTNSCIDSNEIFVDGLYDGWAVDQGRGHREIGAILGGCDYYFPEAEPSKCKEGTDHFRFYILQ